LMVRPGGPAKAMRDKRTLTTSPAESPAPPASPTVGVVYSEVTTMNGEGGMVSATVANRVPLKMFAVTMFANTTRELKYAGVRLNSNVPPSVAVPATCRVS